MMTSKFLGAAAIAVSLLTAGAASADNSQPQRFGTTPDIQVGQTLPGVLVQLISCQMGSGDVVADVLIRNNSSQVIAPGTQIYWQTNGGYSGVVNTGLPGLAPGAMLNAGEAPYPFTCTAAIR